MRYGIISDIHGNWEALHAILEYLHAEHMDRYICLGDLVGYGANPNECVGQIRSLTDRVVAGNHDWAAIGKTDISSFNVYARQAVLWTSGTLNTLNRTYMERLPLRYSEEDLLFVHATPDVPELWGYVLSPYDAWGVLRSLEQWMCVIGHSHYPVAFSWDRKEKVQVHPPCLTLQKGWKYTVNVGSVGQPRDGDPRACCGVLDLDQQTIEVKRVAYDIQTAQEKIRRAGLPEYLAERIARGK